MFNNLSLHSCVSMARAKLHNSVSNGAKETRLCRWVLLKNTLSTSLGRSTDHETHVRAQAPTEKPNDQSVVADAEDEFEIFQFPDGDVFADSFDVDSGSASHDGGDIDLEGKLSEAQWLDSLLQSLGEDTDDAEPETMVSIVSVEEDDDEDPDLASLLGTPSTEDLSIDSPTSPESIRLPPSPPLPPLGILGHSYHQLYRLYSSTSVEDSTSSCDDDVPSLTLPEAAEDSCSDTDSESLNTPYMRSITSLADFQPDLNTGLRGEPAIRVIEGGDFSNLFDEDGLSIGDLGPYAQEC